MEELTPEEFKHWQASYRLDPWGDDWERTSASTAMLVNEARAARAMQGAECELVELDMLVPYRRKRRRERAIEKSLIALDKNRGL